MMDGFILRPAHAGTPGQSVGDSPDRRMKRHDCKTAPSPKRVRVFLAKKGLDSPRIEIDLRAGEHLGPRFRAVSPYCTVPVLALDEGTRLRSAAGIWRYIEDIHPEAPLTGRTATEKGAHRRHPVAHRERRPCRRGRMAAPFSSGHEESSVHRSAR